LFDLWLPFIARLLGKPCNADGQCLATTNGSSCTLLNGTNTCQCLDGWLQWNTSLCLQCKATAHAKLTYSSFPSALVHNLKLSFELFKTHGLIYFGLFLDYKSQLPSAELSSVRPMSGNNARIDLPQQRLPVCVWLCSLQRNPLYCW
jgi:hypothetical protein